MHAGSNRNLAERVHDALIRAAEAKNEALALRKKAERILDAVLIDTSASNQEMRKAVARQNLAYLDADDEAMAAEQSANIAKAEADGLMIQFEAWRTEEASRRHDNKFISAMPRGAA